MVTISQACEGCLLYKTAIGRSPHTISDYRNAYAKLHLFFPADPPFESITRAQLIDFFAWLQNDYVSDPDGIAPRGHIRLSPKSIYNIHTALSSLWAWGVTEGYVTENIIRTIDPPKYERPVIEPFTKSQIKALLRACENTRTWKNRATSSRRPTADRDKAIVLLLLDTGIRRAELCDLTLDDIDLHANTIRVAGKGRGRDKKERVAYFGKSTARALWRYITPRLADAARLDPLFTVNYDQATPLNPDHLRRLLHRLGNRANVPNVHPHRFRHTFAITYLRNGGDPFTLQILLGHSNLDMVKRYLAIVRTDCRDAHQRASPVDRWHL